METVIAKDHNKTDSPGQPNLFAAMDQIRQMAEQHGFSEEFFQEARWKLETVAGLLNVSPLQAALFTLILEHSGNHVLFTDGLLEHVCDNGLADTFEYRLSGEAMTDFSGCGSPFLRICHNFLAHQAVYDLPNACVRDVAFIWSHSAEKLSTAINRTGRRAFAGSTSGGFRVISSSRASYSAPVSLGMGISYRRNKW